MKEGWQVKRLGDISTISYGYTAKSSTEKGNYKYLRITDIQNNSVFWENVPFCNCSKEDATKYELIEGDIVFVRTGATTGKSFLLKGNFPKSLFASYLIRLQLINKDELLPDFLRYYFDTSEYWDIINIGIVGAAQGGFNATKLSQLRIPTPRLSEQQRIVKILDTAFAKIDTVKQNAERNLQNAKELFQSVLDQSFISSETYGVKKIIDILEKTETTNPLNKPNFFFKYIDVSSVSNKTFRIEETSTIIGKDAPSRARKLIKKGDVIFATVRPTLKRISVIPEEFDNEICSTGYCVLRPSEKTLTYWIFYFFQTTSFLSIMERLQRGASYPAVTDGDIKNQIIPVPPLYEQQQIVSKLDALSAKCKELENNYLKTINDYDELKKAILAKAFNGEL